MNSTTPTNSSATNAGTPAAPRYEGQAISEALQFVDAWRHLHAKRRGKAASIAILLADTNAHLLRERDELRERVAALCAENTQAQGSIHRLERDCKTYDAALALAAKQLADSEAARKGAVEALEKAWIAIEALRFAYIPDGHSKPHDCFATGPRTGDAIQDYIACPGCSAEIHYHEAKKLRALTTHNQSTGNAGREGREET